jgi:hypothetical protein
MPEKTEYYRWMNALKIMKAGNENDRSLYYTSLVSLKREFGDPTEIIGNRAVFFDSIDWAKVKAPLNSAGVSENRVELQKTGGCVLSFSGLDVLLTPHPENRL